jgi:hypothetical protein
MTLPANLPTPILPTSDFQPIDEQMCFMHKGSLSEQIYTCGCGVKMCLECAIRRGKSKFNRLCPKCSSVIFIKIDRS